MNISERRSSEGISHSTVGIIGGGVAGATIALRLAELGISINLFEEGRSLVNGPPICHLHAGGNLYREISNQQCLNLLEQSIDTLRVFKHTANIRPTVIAVPIDDNSSALDLIPRLNLLKDTYQALVKQDNKNKVLGDPSDYFTLYSQQDIEKLKKLDNPTHPITPDDWMIPVAKSLQLNQFKYPIVMVQEYGLSVFRIAATASLALKQMENCHVLLSSKVTDAKFDQVSQQWLITYETQDNKQQCTVDYLINACGYRSGTIDDLVHIPRERMVEFKAAYVTHWDQCEGQWPEVIIHGERGTPKGMAQLTPYPNGYFQLHGMTKDITLFENGLVTSDHSSAQPKLNDDFKAKLNRQWSEEEVIERTEKAIKHVAQYVDTFKSAVVGGKPLFGAQQIPGADATLRAADISFSGNNYARSEIVKASSALSAADAIVSELTTKGIITSHHDDVNTREQLFSTTLQLDKQDILVKAENIAVQRGFPASLAQPIG
ncbi:MULTISPECIES: FAD-dependent oxidoreductase [unclassified Photobacterium]|uniref:FAD-dependent oxidoreductase n=1 Tax=unclassified Photobacterium TaxID=2628852 RepID=UPI001EDE42E8|nr:MULTISPECIES: FAD-dependent oxidoreductase [unclassified Photobacterium]MCG3864188.1 FAD-dependent oxidoreductase [Photobacterium sp. Ph6]MCG3875718.1 FAD-dependent oxidoreductase [Photobacterium sp. Ph5]